MDDGIPLSDLVGNWFLAQVSPKSSPTLLASVFVLDGVHLQGITNFLDYKIEQLLGNNDSVSKRYMSSNKFVSIRNGKIVVKNILNAAYIKEIYDFLIYEFPKCNKECVQFVYSFVDQYALRENVRNNSGVAFIINDSILPTQATSNTVPFVSPTSLEVEFNLPYKGLVKGMLIKKGVTIVTGPGFHGKSTFLKAVSNGMLYKHPHDPYEFIVTDSSASIIKSEEGRYVNTVDISPFISNLPEAVETVPTVFQTDNASGSTSMASSVIEAIESGCKLFLIDEDSCASNFMIQCSRMRALLKEVTITPLIYRINSMYHELGVSSIIVVGGSGDWFDVHDTAIMMENYKCFDVTEKAKSISRAFCTGRVQYNGRGLVHQLKWPFSTPRRTRKLQISSLLPSYETCVTTTPTTNIYELIKYKNKSLIYGKDIIDLSLLAPNLSDSDALSVGYSILKLAITVLRANDCFQDKKTDELWMSLPNLVQFYINLFSDDENEFKDNSLGLALVPSFWSLPTNLVYCINRLKSAKFRYETDP